MAEADATGIGGNGALKTENGAEYCGQRPSTVRMSFSLV
jgi:hypothetical protein